MKRLDFARSRLGVAVLASPVVFLVHDLEEYWTQADWLRDTAAQLPALLRDRIPESEVYGLAFALLFAVQLVAALGAVRSARSGTLVVVFAALVMGRITNVLVHGVQALFLRSYVPGLVTAWVVVLPFGTWIFWQLARRGWIRRTWVLPLFLVGFGVQALAIATSLVLSAWLLR